MAVSGIASADEIISFTGTVPTQLTELNNANVQLTAWNPGGSGSFNTIASDTTSYAPITNTGVTMASLDTPGVTYTLQSYDILVTSSVTGSFSATATGTTSAQGYTFLSSYTAASLGSTMTGLTSTNDPVNDFFNDGSNGSSGPDPTTSHLNINSLAPGNTQGPSTFSKTQSSDYGLTLQTDTQGTGYTPVAAGTGVTVSGTSPLNFYFSTATGVTTSLTSGNVSTSQTTSVHELVTVVYDFTTSSSGGVIPEPATMVLFGSALVGLGLLRKRARR